MGIQELKAARSEGEMAGTKPSSDDVTCPYAHSHFQLGLAWANGFVVGREQCRERQVGADS